MTSVESRSVPPCDRLGGSVSVAGDKSVSHRAAMLAALADGESILEGFLVSEDCLNTLRAVERMGARVMREGTNVKIRGVGGRFQAPSDELDMGNSGTGMRLLAGLLAGHSFVSQMTGDASLRSRPMRRIKEPLERMGAEVELLGPNGCAPIRLHGGGLQAIWYPLPMASAQVKSCVLLAGLYAGGRTSVIEPKPTRDHTERILRRLGVEVETDGPMTSVTGDPELGPVLRPANLVVPGDFSSAAFWMAAAAAREGSEVTIENVGLNPRRTALLDVLRRMGASVEIGPVVLPRTVGPKGRGRRAPAAAESDNSQGVWEERGRVTIRGRKLTGTDVGGDEIPNLIDELPLVGVMGALSAGRTVIRDAAELRVKESDRIATMCSVLKAFGVTVEEKPDGMIVHGCRSIKGGARIASRGDHRIAMSAAILALFADSPVLVEDIGCIATSYPGFWMDLERLTGPEIG